MLIVFVVSVEMGQQQRNKLIAQKLAQKVLRSLGIVLICHTFRDERNY
jgi:hypothetical protein